MINWIIVGFGILGVCSQIATRKLHEREKPAFLVALNYSSMICIILLGGYGQYAASQNNEDYRKANLGIEVLSKASEHFMPVLKNMGVLQNNMLTVKQYLSYQDAQKRHPELAVAIDWGKNSSAAHKKELQSAQESFSQIQNSAAEIINLNIAHGSIIPAETVEWAKGTLNIKFSDVENFFDPYAPIDEDPKESVLGYADQTGRAFGVVIGRLRSATNVLADG